jgi:hypothetical protein
MGSQELSDGQGLKVVQRLCLLALGPTTVEEALDDSLNLSSVLLCVEALEMACQPELWFVGERRHCGGRTRGSVDHPCIVPFKFIEVRVTHPRQLDWIVFAALSFFKRRRVRKPRAMV